MAPRQEHSFNVKMTGSEWQALGRLAADLGLSKAQILRQALIWRDRMLYEHRPTCASGQPCMCPHLWAQTYAPPPQTPAGAAAVAPHLTDGAA